MSLNARQRYEACCNARGVEESGDRLLLADREQQIRLHPDHERFGQARASEERDRIAVRGEVEAIDGARDVEIAVGIEGVDEALRQSFEIALHGELGSERIMSAHVGTNRLAAEAL